MAIQLVDSPAGSDPSVALVTGECRHGLMVWPGADNTIGRSLSLYGEFAEGENRVMARYVSPGDVVVDVGANVGTTVLPLARAVGSHGQVIAFEPQPLLGQCLQTSPSLNNLYNVRLFSAALGNASGWATMSIPQVGEAANYGAMGLADKGLKVPILRLDELGLTRCSLLKIDVEGHEWPVLQGAQSFLLACRPVIYFEAKRIPGTERCLEWLLAHGWQCYWHFAFFYRSDNHKQNCDDIFSGIGDMNVLAVPDGRILPEDLPCIKSPAEDWRQTYSQFLAAHPVAGLR